MAEAFITRALHLPLTHRLKSDKHLQQNRSHRKFHLYKLWKIDKVMKRAKE